MSKQTFLGLGLAAATMFFMCSCQASNDTRQLSGINYETIDDEGGGAECSDFEEEECLDTNPCVWNAESETCENGHDYCNSLTEDDPDLCNEQDACAWEDEEGFCKFTSR